MSSRDKIAQQAERVSRPIAKDAVICVRESHQSDLIRPHRR